MLIKHVAQQFRGRIQTNLSVAVSKRPESDKCDSEVRFSRLKKKKKKKKMAAKRRRQITEETKADLTRRNYLVGLEREAARDWLVENAVRGSGHSSS